MQEPPQYYIYYVLDDDLALDDDPAEGRQFTSWNWVLVCFVLLLLCYVVFGPLSGIFFPTTGSSRASTQGTTSFSASRALLRLNQMDEAQYSSPQEYNTWAGSACSSASMTEVINSYGHRYRITDILQVESQIGEITPQQGLLEEVGIQRTLSRFGFKTTWGHNFSLDQIIAIADQGHPVIVSFPPGTSQDYAPGHLLVVTGGNSSSVLLADSSLWNRHSLSRALFLDWWRGFYAIATPA
jgi:Peptidase_C39 like family